MLFTRLVSLLLLCCLGCGLIGCSNKAQIAPSGTMPTPSVPKKNNIDKVGDN